MVVKYRFPKEKLYLTNLSAKRKESSALSGPFRGPGWV
jgi:hypothetical protein